MNVDRLRLLIHDLLEEEDLVVHEQGKRLIVETEEGPPIVVLISLGRFDSEAPE